MVLKSAGLGDDCDVILALCLNNLTLSLNRLSKAVASKSEGNQFDGIDDDSTRSVNTALLSLRPSLELRGVPLDAGINIDDNCVLSNEGNQSWPLALLDAFPNVSKVQHADWETLEALLSEAEVLEQQIVKKIYAGMLGPRQRQVPGVRKDLLENGLDMKLANTMEKQNKFSVSDLEAGDFEEEGEGGIHGLSEVAAKVKSIQTRMSALGNLGDDGNAAEGNDAGTDPASDEYEKKVREEP